MAALGLRHKIAAYVAGPVAAHHAVDMAREHVFLAVHEAISHAGWIIYSVAGTLIAVPALSFLAYRYFRDERKEKEEEAN